MSFQIVDEICKYPFVRFIIPFIIGISLAILFDIPYVYGLGLFIVSFVLLILLSLKPRYKLIIPIGIAINIIFISIGIFITSFKISSNNYDIDSYNSGFIIGEIYKDPKINGKNTILNIEILAIRNNDIWSSASGYSVLYLASDDKTEELIVGDRIIFNPQLSEIENKGNPNEFDFKKYLAYNLILSCDFLSSEDWKVLPAEDNLKFSFRILRFRQMMLNALAENGLKDDELAVVAALALGYKDRLSDDLKHNYSASGAMHILAVSGLHVGVIYGILIFAFSFIRSKKFNYVKIAIIIIFIWFYACLTGLSPSVCRAALMFSIISIGGLGNRTIASLNSVAASVFILLFINPLDIVNVGFQMSYLAVIGIIILQPKIHELFEVKSWILKKAWSLISVSIAAQLAVAPLCLYYFNSFSNYFIITNIFLIPIASITIWTFVLAFIFIKIKIVAVFFIKILSFIVRIMNSIVAEIESLPYSVLDGIYIDFTSMILLYLLIISLSLFFFYSKRYKDLVYSLFIVILLFSINIIDSVKNINQKYFIVYNIHKSTAINVIDGRDNILFARLDSTYNNTAKTITKSNWIEKGLSGEKYIDLLNKRKSILSDIVTIDNSSVFWKKNMLAFCDIRVFVLDDSFIPFETDASYDKIKLDYVVLSNNPSVNLREISKLFNFKKVIIDSSNSRYYIEKLIVENEDLNLDIFNVQEDGAFILEI